MLELSLLPADPVQLVIQGGAIGVMFLLGLKMLSVFEKLLTEGLARINDSLQGLTRVSEKSVDRLDLILSSTILNRPSQPVPPTTQSAAQAIERVVEVKEVVVAPRLTPPNGDSETPPQAPQDHSTTGTSAA